MEIYNCYLTDLFGGELNYCFITRLRVKAKTKHGALCKIAKETGLNFRNYFNGEIYYSTSGLTALVFDTDELTAEEYQDAEVI